MVSDEQLLEDLRDFADEIGETPTQREMAEYGPWSEWTYKNHFDSWNNALNKAGLKVKMKYVESDEQLLEDLKDFADEIGRTPTSRDMRKNGPWDYTTYERRFGSWNNALNKAGLKVKMKYVESDEQLLEDLKDFADDIGDTPTEEEMEKNGPWSIYPYRKYFGSWNNALKRAGFDVKIEIEYVESDEQLLEDLKDFADEIGRTPTSRKMTEDGPWSAKTYKKYFGSWNNSLKQAGLTPKRENKLDVKWDDSVSNYFGESYKEMREKAKERDGEKCRACSSEERLHVHHIKPRRLFENPDASNTLDNLITLCPSCHKIFENEWIECDPDEFAERAKASLNKQ